MQVARFIWSDGGSQGTEDFGQNILGLRLSNERVRQSHFIPNIGVHPRSFFGKDVGRRTWSLRQGNIHGQRKERG